MTCANMPQSCEKVRLSLEDCDVEKDISNFIKECGTGQEIPDPPKFINFCRGDLNDAASEASDDEAYSVAQFQRTINPAYRTSSPSPKKMEAHNEKATTPEIQPDMNPLRASQNSTRSADPYEELPKVPHNDYPMDGMTQFCRIGPPSDRSSIPSPTRPESRDDRSDYSNPTSHSSYGGPSSGMNSPTKQYSVQEEKQVQKRKSGFFQNHSPFRRKSKHEKEFSNPTGSVTSRNGYSAQSNSASPTKSFGRQSRNAHFGPDASASPDPEPVDPRANFQLNVGNNVFDVASPDARGKPPAPAASGDLDPIAQALAEFKGVTKQTSLRVSADRYHGLATPAPSVAPSSGDSTPRPFAGQELRSNQGRTPPPSYDARPQSSLGAPQPAFTSKQMRQTTATYVNKGRDMFNAPPQGSYEQRSQSAMGRPSTREGRPQEMARSASPGPPRSTSPRPYMNGDRRGQQPMPRSASPNPYGTSPQQQQSRPRANTASPQKQGYGGPPPNQMRSRSPQPGHRPGSSQGAGQGMAMQLSQGPPGQEPYFKAPRPTSQLYGDGPYSLAASGGQPAMRPRANSNTGGGRQVTKDGRPILHFCKSSRFIVGNRGHN